jgi:chromosome segregation ATPase
VITVLNKAVSISNEEHKRAMALTDDLANKLRTTERRIKELEAEASSFRDRAARAEEWMQRISHEIESKFIAPEGAPPKTPSGSSNQDR